MRARLFCKILRKYYSMKKFEPPNRTLREAVGEVWVG